MSEGKQAILPRSMTAPLIWNMEVGDCGWVSITDMYVDADRRCWLKTHAKVGSGTPRGALLIARREDGLHVWVPPDTKWTPTNYSGPLGLPVVEIYERSSRADEEVARWAAG